MVFAVALGVAVVLAIELAGNAAAGSFRSSVETLSGNTNLEVTAAGGVPDAVVARIATLPFPLQIHPRIEDFAVISATGQTLPLIGLDLIGEANGDAVDTICRAGSGVGLANGDREVQATCGLAQAWGRKRATRFGC